MSKHTFTDPIRKQQCTLIVRPGWVGVEHPGCDHPAGVTTILDAFVCRVCKWSGRISGAWVMDMTAAAECPVVDHHYEIVGVCDECGGACPDCSEAGYD